MRLLEISYLVPHIDASMMFYGRCTIINYYREWEKITQPGYVEILLSRNGNSFVMNASTWDLYTPGDLVLPLE